MYEKISNKKKWSIELISISKSEAGGLKEVIASIKGTNIYSTLNMKVVFIEFKEFLIQKHKEEYIHLLQQLQFYLRQKKLI